MRTSERIVVIDDEPGMCRLLKTVLGDAGYRVETFEKPAEALKALAESPCELVITDIRMPKTSGIDVLRAVKSTAPATAVILITAHGSVEAAVQAMKLGASDYVTKPFKNEEIRLAVEGVLEKQRLIAENTRLKLELASRYRFGEIIGGSSKIRDTFRLISQLAQTDVTVLVQGESGTGKELVARALHHNSPRGDHPFMAIHCGALPETLLESELFGHVKGAFTDAGKDRKGLLESAEGGTVFLDEVGEMPGSSQVKLLRFLQDHEVRRLGSSESRKVDVRVVAATNRDLRKDISAGRFREDLFYRLSVVPILLPPLRERKEDIPALIEHFLQKAGQKAGKKDFAMDPESLQILLDYEWPGNVRELENAIEHAVALAQSAKISPDALPLALRSGAPLPGSVHGEIRSYRDAKQGVLESFEKSYLTDLLGRANGNITQAARMADMDRKNLYDLLKKNGIVLRDESSASA